MPRTLRIDRRNSTFQVLESLVSNRQKRHRARSFVIEGVRPISVAVAHAWPLTAVLYARERPLSRWAAGIVHGTAADRYELASDLLASLSRKDDPSELLVVASMPDAGLGRVPVTSNLLAAVVDRPSNPGNLGTLIRSCDAFGASALIVSGHGVDVYDPATITASRGSLFALPVVQADSHTDLLRWAEGVRQTVGGCQIVGADEQASGDVADHDLTGPTILVFGNEARGLSHAYREACDACVRIPMTGAASSLNVSVAASIVLYEAIRQRRGKESGKVEKWKSREVGRQSCSVRSVSRSAAPRVNR